MTQILFATQGRAVGGGGGETVKPYRGNMFLQRGPKLGNLACLPRIFLNLGI